MLESFLEGLRRGRAPRDHALLGSRAVLRGAHPVAGAARRAEALLALPREEMRRWREIERGAQWTAVLAETYFRPWSKRQVIARRLGWPAPVAGAVLRGRQPVPGSDGRDPARPAVGGPPLDASTVDPYPIRDRQPRTRILHYAEGLEEGVEIEIALAAWPAHAAHGDAPLGCGDACSTGD